MVQKSSTLVESTNLSKPLKTSFLIAAAMATLLAPATETLANDHSSPAPQQPEPKQAAPKESHHHGFKVEMERGQVLQLIAPQSRPDGEAARKAYYDYALPRAGELGFRRHGQLNVRQKVISDFDPGAFIFFSWPDQASLDAFSSQPDWNAVKASRPEGWDELKIYTIELTQDLSLQFDPEKHYTVVVAWLDQDGASDYDRYLDGIEPAMQRAGGRFIYKMRSPMLEAHNSAPEAPGQITLVEWNSSDGFAKVQQSQEYLDHRQYFASGVDRFEFYWLETRR